MPLEWREVVRRYAVNPVIHTPTGTRELEVASVDDNGIRVRTRLWTKTVAREHLARAVALIEAGELTDRWGSFVEEFGRLVTTERRTLAASILKDLGYLR